ncbi:unnamed protein product [Vitrella brassicaformis CCMP3155]|uniref:EF-hand domain-containing protein n=1 Tax=Vitrella brassicaformis (strain CCMP3155) TaxID=1169540 RepID=A0A0G4G1S5_VITBC|nr:unnamed protein product [Vitrella brassicaformis CCMP3155]|mmetsp:Transcript_47121/g.117513  ORF Transcript_47121/g.117513 Transcript_47121/m.117513 type:complete len:330 (-) Transcript_47121:430-1419(-)|eukprot:CEM21841.1 unnamed protein product [Vitrella brassicaformis CCMP3155]
MATNAPTGTHTPNERSVVVSGKKIPPPTRTDIFTDAVQALSGKSAACGDRLVQILRAWDTDGNGKFDVAEVIRAAQHIESEQRKSKGLRWLIAAMCVMYLITIVIFFAVAYGANEVSEDFRIDKNTADLGTKRRPRNTVLTKQTFDGVDMFDFLTEDLEDLYKVESLYLNYTAGEGQTVEKYFRISEITRNKATDLVEVKFLTGSKLQIMSEGANLILAGDNDTQPVTLFEGPNYTFDTKRLVWDEDGDGVPDDESRIVQANATNGDVNGTDGSRRRLAPTRFGNPGRGNIFFNSGRLYGRGINDLGASRFNALAVRGRCLGTRFACRG